MPAHFIPIGEPAHDAERQAIAFLVSSLPRSYTVYGNAWVVERGGVVYELDAIVVAPHAIFVVEIKSFRGRIEGTDNDWYVGGEAIKSPLRLNRKTAQVLNSQLRRETFAAGQVWVQGFVFLSSTNNVGVKGPASQGRIHTRQSILAALQDEALVQRLSGRRSLVPSSEAENDLLRILQAAQRGPRPVRRIREYEVVAVLDHQETYTEFLGKNTLSGDMRILRVYSIPHLATEAQRERIIERARWEAQVLGRLGRSMGILSVDPPFSDEAGIVLPFEYFRGVTLSTWLDRYGPGARGASTANLKARTDLWMRLAQTIDDAHQQGVVHRLLRPDVILVEDDPEPQQVRVTGFDLAKQLSLDTTVSLTTIGDERLQLAAPEVVNAFSSAEPASDQFSLGAILALLLTGQPLFDSTRALLASRRLLRRVRDLAQRIPLSLDEAVTRMVALRPTDRFPSLSEAIEAVRRGRDPDTRTAQPLFPDRRAPLDPDNLEPGMRVGADYEVLSRLGQGGMAVVYAARHLVSGRTRALKIASANDAAEEALRGEYNALSRLDHPNVVRVIDLSKMVEGRLTLVMERVGGKNLRHWLQDGSAPDPQTQRRLAEDLLAGLDYLEQQGVTHKDLKPDNLLVGDGRLTIIDFSLADVPDDAPYGGTALYRDPASARWTHGTDRYAAALCLFEVYAGRHAFDGRVPEPGQRPLVGPDDIQPPGLSAFFQKALDPSPEARFRSAREMRDGLLTALGAKVDDEAASADATDVDEKTPLRTTGLSRRAVNALERCQVRTVGELLALTADQVRAIHAIGTKTATDIVVFQDALRERGLLAEADAGLVEPPLVEELAWSPEPVDRLSLPAGLRAALADAGHRTVGAVASLSRSGLLAVPGIGRKSLAQVVEALHAFVERTTEVEAGGHTLDRIWELAAHALTEGQRIAVERFVGITGEPEVQGDIARDLGRSQPSVSVDFSRGIECLDLGALSELMSAVEPAIEGFGGIVRLDELGARFESEWPGGVVSGAGMVRLLVRLSQGRTHVIEVDGVEAPLVTRTAFDRATLKGFAAEVLRLASQWPPVEPESARRTLAAMLPEYPGDPLALGVRLCSDVQLTDSGHLYVPPVDAPQAIAFVLAQAREPLDVEALRQRVRAAFGDFAHWPQPDHLLAVLRDQDCRVEGDLIVPGRTRSVVASQPLASDALPTGLGADRSPEEVVRDMLGEAARSRGFRMLVTPPERHAEIGPSVARALGAEWVSFEEAFFLDHHADIASLERAERFIAQRDALTEAAEETLFRLLEENGRPGHSVVLGDTALLGLCEALDLPRRLYDETLGGGHGFWVLVVPGVIHNRQPRFNEGKTMWHLEGATLPLLNPLPVESHA